MVDKLTGFNPNIAIPPGETLIEFLNSIEMSQVELSKRIGISTKHLSGIIKGKASITPETALGLESIFGTPASFWNNLEVKYREIKTRLEEKEKILNETGVAKIIPYANIANLGFVTRTRKAEEKVINLRSFFGTASLEFVPDVIPAAFRRTMQREASSLSLAAWLRIGEILAGKVETEPFDKEKVQSVIPDLKKLSLLNPEEFLPGIERYCVSCGIVFVLVPHLPKTYAYGATKWVSPKKALLQLGNRGSYADIFWFTFFHELGHIILHSKKETFIEEDGTSNKIEQEADEFASKTLISRKEYEIFIGKDNITRQSIMEFSEKMEIHPCILVGRLQHDGIIDYRDFHDLKPRFKWAKD